MLHDDDENDGQEEDDEEPQEEEEDQATKDKKIAVKKALEAKLKQKKQIEGNGASQDDSEDESPSKARNLGNGAADIDPMVHLIE